MNNEFLKDIDPEEIAYLEMCLDASRCKKDFFYFCQLFFDTFNSDTPTWLAYHKYICDRFQKAGERLAYGFPKLKDLILNAPPSSGKSVIGILFRAWLWTINPAIKILAVSYSQDYAYTLAEKLRDVILSDKYQKMFPYVELKTDSKSKSDFHNTKMGEHYTTSVKGSITGRKCDLIFIDDPLDRGDIYSDKDREATNKFVSSLESRLSTPSQGLTMVIAQRLCSRDTTNHLLAQGGDYEMIILPAEESKIIFPEKLSVLYKDGLLDPKRLSEHHLRKMKERDVREYVSQYLQNPADDADSIIKSSWFKIIDQEMFKIITKGRELVIDFYCDTAYTDNKKRNDPQVILAASFVDGTCYIMNVYRKWEEVPQFTRHLKAFVIQNGYSVRSRIFIEPQSSGLGIIQTLKQETSLNIIAAPFNNKETKQGRLNMVTPSLQAERVKLLKGDWNIAFVNEVSMTESSHDDQRDAMIMMIFQNLMKKVGSGRMGVQFF